MSTSKRIVVIGMAVTALAVGSPASAEEGQGEHRFGNPGFIVSADRLLPLISYQSTETTQNGTSDTQSRVSIALMNNAPFEAYSTFYNLPRLAFDWLPVQNLTLGGAAWLYADLLATNSSGGTSTDQAKLTYWGIAPRVGYIIAMGDKVSFWPRAGVEYNSVSSSDGSLSVTQFAVDARSHARHLAVEPLRLHGRPHGRHPHQRQADAHGRGRRWGRDRPRSIRRCCRWVCRRECSGTSEPD